jgi:hypothetical protein
LPQVPPESVGPGPLPQIYLDELLVLYNNRNRAVTLEELAAAVGVSTAKVTAHLSKISGRMKRIATPEELNTLSTPFCFGGDRVYGESLKAVQTDDGGDVGRHAAVQSRG